MIDCLLLICFAVVPAIVLHELAHGLSAFFLGDTTAKKQGRLTLNPIKHMDLVGSVIVPGGLFLLHYFGFTKSMLLFGWAKPVPVNFSLLKPRRLGIIIVALCGPLTNIVLAWLMIQGYSQAWAHPVAHLFGWAVMLNLMLAVFNMIPIPPLDGSRVVSALLPASMARTYNSLEPFGFVIIVILMQLNMLQFMYPIISWLGNLLGIQI